MLLLRNIKEISKKRPGSPKFEDAVYIADDEKFKQDWESIFNEIKNIHPQNPLRELRELKKHISPHGFYGYRTHPITGEEKYFHLGIEILTKTRQNIYPIFRGELEYSGFGIREGNYVLISHPDIQTEDGYTLHTMYCHMKKPLVKFTAHQKMLREISLGTYPHILIDKDRIIGTSGSTGITVGNEPILYLQIDFRKFEEKPIIINPLQILE